MKKSKHFRKDVIVARVIAGVVLIALIVLLVWGISLLSKPSEKEQDSQNTQNTEDTQDVLPDIPGTESPDVEVGTEDTQMPSTEESEPTEPEVLSWIETTATLRLREEPNTRCATIEQIPEGTRIGVLEDLNGWYKVSYNGNVGYVSKTYVRVLPEE